MLSFAAVIVVGGGLIAPVLLLLSILVASVNALAFEPAGRREILQWGGGAVLASVASTTSHPSPPPNDESAEDDVYLRNAFRMLFPGRERRRQPTQRGSTSLQSPFLEWSPPSQDFSNLRYGTSSLSSGEGIVPRSACRSLPSLPPWMEGYWLVSYEFDGASFANGRGGVSPALPGVGLGTCAALPNVGASPAPFVQRFGNGSFEFDDDDDEKRPPSSVVVEDVAYNLPRKFEGFWPQAKVTSVRVSASTAPGSTATPLGPSCLVTGEGCSPSENPDLHGKQATRCRVEYSGPTRRGGFRTQHLDVTMVDCFATSSAFSSRINVIDDDEKDDAFLMARSFVQSNQEQELTGYYREFVSYERRRRQKQSNLSPKGEIAWGKTCVAAFLPSSQAPVALYKYSLKLDAVTRGEAKLY